MFVKRLSADYIPATMRMRRRRRAEENPGMRITGLGCALLVSIFTVVVLLALTGLYAALTRDLPSPESLAAYLDPPDGTLLQPTRLYDRPDTLFYGHIHAISEREKGVRYHG